MNDAVALWTFVLAAITGLLAFLSIRADKTARIAAEAARDSAATAKQALANVERPYVFIVCDGRLNVDSGLVSSYVEYAVVNHGKSAAIVQDVMISLAAGTAGEPKPGLRVGSLHPLLRDPLFAPDEDRVRLRAEASDDIWVKRLSTEEYTLDMEGPVFLSIQIFYNGTFTRGHDTLRTWRFDTQANRFVEVFTSDERFNHVK